MRKFSNHFLITSLLSVFCIKSPESEPPCLSYFSGPKTASGLKMSMVKPAIDDMGRLSISTDKYEFTSGLVTFLPNSDYMGTWNCKAEAGERHEISFT